MTKNSNGTVFNSRFFNRSSARIKSKFYAKSLPSDDMQYSIIICI